MAKSTNPWILHLAKVRKANPKLSFKQAIKEAKKDYKPKK